MTCPHCQLDIQEEVIICPNCQQQIINKPNQRRTSGAIVLIVMGVAVLVIWLSLRYFGLQLKEEKKLWDETHKKNPSQQDQPIKK